MKPLTWHEYFMGVARLSCLRSKDPNTQTGACIVNQKNRIIGVGYNGMPGGKDELPWQRDGNFLESKYAYVVHAEANAILNAVSNLEGATLYASLFPCNECAKIIVQAGITKVFYYSDKYHTDAKFVASRRIFDVNNIAYEQLPAFDFTKLSC